MNSWNFSMIHLRVNIWSTADLTGLKQHWHSPTISPLCGPVCLPGSYNFGQHLRVTFKREIYHYYELSVFCSYHTQTSNNSWGIRPIPTTCHSFGMCSSCQILHTKAAFFRTSVAQLSSPGAVLPVIDFIDPLISVRVGSSTSSASPSLKAPPCFQPFSPPPGTNH